MNILVVSFRGFKIKICSYGDSEGVASRSGLVEDVKSMVKFTNQRNDIDKSKIYLHGRGLGASAAVYALREDN